MANTDLEITVVCQHFNFGAVGYFAHLLMQKGPCILSEVGFSNVMGCL